MTTLRILTTVALAGLCACSLIAKGKGASSSGSSPIAADPDDPPAVKNKLAELEDIEKLLAESRWSDYAVKSKRLHSYFLFEKGLDGQPKREAIMQRLDALDAKAFATFPRLQALVGEGPRVLEVDTDVLEPLVDVLNACDGSQDIRSKGALDEKLAVYEKAIGRVKKVDAKGFRYFGETKSRFGTADVPSALIACEGNLAGAAAGFADAYVEETVPATEVEVGCGKAVFLADGIHTGPNQFADYTRTEGGAAYPEKLDCKKLPKKSKFGRAFAAAVTDYAKYIEIPEREIVVVADGKPYVEEAQSDGRLHRFQELVAYSKKFRFGKNPCGGEKIFCEAGGSKGAQAFNRLEHALERAQVHAGTNPQLCKAHLKDAKSRADWFAEFHADAKKDGSWITGATYKTKKGQQLKEPAFIAAFKDKGQLADDRLLGKYCDTAAKPTTAAR
jgi:hypothetical protein